MRTDFGYGSKKKRRRSWSTRTRTETGKPAQRVPQRTRYRSFLLEVLVDPLAVRADRRPRLGGLGDGKDFPAQRHHMGAHHRTLGDLVLLHVVEELGPVAVRPVVDLLVGVGALDGLGVHTRHSAQRMTVREPTRRSRCGCGTVEV